MQKKFGRILKEARELRGLTQDALADAAEVHRGMIGRYEIDSGKPTIDVLIKLAGALNVSTDYLLGLTDKTDGVTHEWTEEDGDPVILFNREARQPDDNEKRAFEQEHESSLKNNEIEKIVDSRLREIFGEFINKPLNGG
jgi:transcriptional regulator with XRE-family HTH domain